MGNIDVRGIKHFVIFHFLRELQLIRQREILAKESHAVALWSKLVNPTEMG